MKFKIISIGKINNKNLSDEIFQLKKRISRLDIIELKEIKEKNIDILKEKESQIILNNIKKEDLNILLIEDGKEYSTKDLFNLYKNKNQTICFILTGAFGPSNNLRKIVHNHLSLSKLTFTHEQAQYMLIEQIYRLNCYEKNIPYNK